MKKLIGLFVFLLLVGTILPATGKEIVEKSSMPFLFGKTLYVGGLGPGNYSIIQEAINDAVDGDTVFVFGDSSPYYENLNVDKSINLIGENKDITVIDGSGIDTVVNISANDVKVSDFTIQNSGKELADSGIQINFRYINISITNNKIFYNTRGISIFQSWNDLIERNNISYNEIGIWVLLSSITISDNTIGNNKWRGIYIHGDETEIYNNIIFGNLSDTYGDEGIEIEGKNNIISGNTITKSNEAINMNSANNNKITGNNILANQYFLFMSDSNGNLISHNNFIDNEREGKENTFFDSFNNKWDGNYWTRARIFPYFIFGKIWIEILGGFSIRWFNIDWHPAKEPYNL